MGLGIPKDAQKAIDAVPEIVSELKAVRRLLERLLDEDDTTQAPGKGLRLRRVGEPHAAFEQP
ncbi:hypothetical protein HWB99_gp060 [Mycobacterium phage DrLupo]|uniref:Uncharacterized protein n=1 Tax=Mycobacterium phage DrLupo TaxID=2499037 RepID=A0A3S9UQN3_9CAUD|nr:hypothetical protein HWB99_gp060 [Mycobacterium phage DrLupo]AZS12596.1 hypothetical protein SEA_DRLUPO_60 [Mycobacterium phage DrLupo]